MILSPRLRELCPIQLRKIVYNLAMAFERIVEEKIQAAMQRGEFDHLPGAGRPLDLSAYFETPGEFRAAYALMKNAGIVPLEAELLRDIALLKERQGAAKEEGARLEIRCAIRAKQLEFEIRMERNRLQHCSGRLGS